MIKESPFSPAAAVYRKVVKAGDYWMETVKAGQIFRIVDLEGNQAADTLFFSARDPSERYSAENTLRDQLHQKFRLVDSLADALTPAVAGVLLVREDVELMASMGIRAARFGVEWSRLIPEEGRPDPAAVERYRQEIAYMR